MEFGHNKRKNVILLAIITMIVLYIAVSVYGVIRDMGTGSTTVFVISSNLPQVEDIDKATPFLERIKNYFNPPAKMIVPVVRKVTIRGRVVYTNDSPYANGLVELRSEPRLTYTDSEGYFIFENVEDGDHIISVLDQNGNVLASCNLTINRSLEIDDAVLVQTGFNTYVLEVEVDVKVLEIVLEIERGNSGQPSGEPSGQPDGQLTGNLIINPEVIVLERYLPGEQPIPEPPTPDKPVIPDPPVTPPGPPPVTPPGPPPVIPPGPPPVIPPGPPPVIPPGPPPIIPPGPPPVIPPAVDALTVYSTVDTKNLPRSPAPAADINIFGSSKRLAPGMTGVYKFTIDNTGNPFAIYYDIDLVETNNSLNIPMKYRLYNNKINSYVNGDANWHTIAEIKVVTANPAAPLSMTDSMKTDYSLEWFWDDGGSLDNSYAEQHAGKVVCTLTLRVSAQRK